MSNYMTKDQLVASLLHAAAKKYESWWNWLDWYDYESPFMPYEPPIPYITMANCKTSIAELVGYANEVRMFIDELRDERIAELVDLNNLCTHCAKSLRKLAKQDVTELLDPLSLSFLRRLLKGLDIPDDIIVEISVHAPKDAKNCDAFKIRQALETEKDCISKGLNSWLSVLNAKK